MTDLNKGRGGGEADFNPSCAAVVNNACYVLMVPPIIIIVRLHVRQIQRVASCTSYAVKFEQVREETDGDVVRWWPAGSVRGPSVSVRGRCDADCRYYIFYSITFAQHSQHLLLSNNNEPILLLRKSDIH